MAAPIRENVLVLRNIQNQYKVKLRRNWYTLDDVWIDAEIAFWLPKIPQILLERAESFRLGRVAALVTSRNNNRLRLESLQAPLADNEVADLIPIIVSVPSSFINIFLYSPLPVCFFFNLLDLWLISH